MPRSPRPTVMSPELVAEAIAHLRRGDSTICRIIDTHGSMTLQLETDPFRVLVRSIISQQISTAAAASIQRRVDLLRGRRKLSAAWVCDTEDEALRQCGLSPQKLRYLRDLAEKVSMRTVDLRTIHERPDAEVIRELTQVLGVGIWTAQMFLIFSLGRLDVLPTGDLGVRAAIEREYQLPAHPTPRQCEEIAQPWRPFASIASWYLWRSSDARLSAEQAALWQ